MDNQPTKPLSILEDEFERRRLKLVEVLGQAEKIENLSMAPEWEFFIDWLGASKDRLVKELSSDAFVNDHNGYLRTVGTLKAINHIVDGIDKFKRAYTTANKQLMELNDQTNG